MNGEDRGVIKHIDPAIVAKKFLVRGYNVSPNAAKLVCSYDDPESLIDEVCKLTKEFVISEQDVVEAIKSLKNKIKANAEKKDREGRFEKEGIVIKDVKNSTIQGSIEDFVSYFNSRFEKLSKILRTRIHPLPIKNVQRYRMEEVSVVGIVSNVIERKDSVVFEIEDNTASIKCLASGKIAEEVKNLLGDEVIGVVGVLKNSMIHLTRIVFPDVPINGEKKVMDFGVVFISDTHFGSKNFLEKEWKRFVEWLNSEEAGRVRYVLVAGDIVDGVGIYPDQEKDLAIVDIYGQYELAAKYFDMFPKDIKIILSPGNHDAVRQAEPQPALPSEIRKLFSNNVKHVGNPAWLNLDGLKVLIYHGRSLDDVVTKLGLSYAEPHKAMAELLKRRHLSPLYGSKSPIIPEREDFLVIENLPDVVHSGHVHTFGVGNYRGIILVNSSTWQSQTDFQKKMNFNPDPCRVAMLLDGKVIPLSFMGG